MNNLTIEGLGKCYDVAPPEGERAARFSPRELVRGIRNRLNGATEEPVQRSKLEFWALRDFSLQVAPGTILGIIGANGAGKSTLLKIIARVTPPTVGRVVGVGRVVSLLELGAGFDAEQAARENVIMNAALTGVSRAEALQCFDEIIEFAKMQEFVNTPLKFFSSGMYLRLAFAVAVKMQPRILLADEILAVGDLAFQERCLEHVEQMGREGLTVLFVSHDMEAIMRVCNRVIWLDHGKLVKDGDPEEVVTEYQNVSWSQADVARSEKGRTANRYAEIMSVRLVSAAGNEVGAPNVNEPFCLRIRFRTLRARLFVRCAADLRVRRELVFRVIDEETRELPEEGIYDAFMKIPANFLSDVNYTAGVSLGIVRDGKEYVLVNYNALSFMAYSSDTAKMGRTQRVGLVSPRLEWSVEQVEVNNVVA
ncbi:MAG: ATP-binding cassette domain-containing protein [Acidobacteria bacterium]|nr:ATP-binding cassette domain-containing protein [Acidobacteriota bacterium]